MGVATPERRRSPGLKARPLGNVPLICGELGPCRRLRLDDNARDHGDHESRDSDDCGCDHRPSPDGPYARASSRPGIQQLMPGLTTRTMDEEHAFGSERLQRMGCRQGLAGL